MIGPGSIVTVRESKANPLIPFNPGELLRVVRVGKYKTDKKRFAVESMDQERTYELFRTHIQPVDMLEVDGKLRTMEAWGRDIGIKVAALKDRLKYGWTAHEAVTTPRGKRLAVP